MCHWAIWFMGRANASCWTRWCIAWAVRGGCLSVTKVGSPAGTAAEGSAGDLRETPHAGQAGSQRSFSGSVAVVAAGSHRFKAIGLVSRGVNDLRQGAGCHRSCVEVEYWWQLGDKCLEFLNPSCFFPSKWKGAAKQSSNAVLDASLNIMAIIWVIDSLFQFISWCICVSSTSFKVSRDL